jgi:hypothetical protein
MKRREFICVLGGIAAGFWPGRRTIVAAMAALVLLPIEVSAAGWLSDVFKSSPKPRTVKLAALGPVALNPSVLKPVATMCDPSKFRIVLDVGHTVPAPPKRLPHAIALHRNCQSSGRNHDADRIRVWFYTRKQKQDFYAAAG